MPVSKRTDAEQWFIHTCTFIREDCTHGDTSCLAKLEEKNIKR